MTRAGSAGPSLLLHSGGSESDVHRHGALEKLFLENYAALMSEAYSEYSAMLVWDAERIMNRLSASLHLYEGPVCSEGFMTWGVAQVRHGAAQHRIAADLLQSYQRLLRWAIVKALGSNVEDCAVDVEDLWNEVAALVFQNAHELVRPGTAKLSTRLVALVRRHVWGYHVRNRVNRHRIVSEHLNSGGGLECEHLSDAELAAERACEEKIAA